MAALKDEGAAVQNTSAHRNAANPLGSHRQAQAS
jgi:hypothetical protein